MRFLFTTIPGFGHFHPLVPLAQALQAAGHTVAVATARSFAPFVERAGFEPIPAGLDWDESDLAATVPDIRSVPEEKQATWIMQRIFLDRSPQKIIPELIEVASTWRPDVVISGTYEFGGALVAEKLGLPYASCSISYRWSRWILQHIVGGPVRRLRRAQGLPPDPEFQAFGRYLDLCFVPPTWTLTEALLRPEFTALLKRKLLSASSGRQKVLCLRTLALQRLMDLDRARRARTAPEPSTTHFIRQTGLQSGQSAPPEWLHDLARQPTVYVSLGTVFNSLYPQVFDTILAGLRDEPVNLILTVGANGDPARFGPQPANVRIERFIPQETLLPHVDLCINHSGYSTVMGALGRGIPLVLLPLSADQPVIAQMCFAAGVAPDLPDPVWRISSDGLPVVTPARLTPAILREAARQVLDRPEYRRAARTLQQQIQALPGLQHAVSLLERLNRERRPIIDSPNSV